MTEKRFTTVELPKPNRWGIWYDGAYLSTYQVCILLNEQHETIQQQKEEIINSHKAYVECLNENKKLKEQLRNLRRLANELYMEGSE